MYMVIDNYRTS